MYTPHLVLQQALGVLQAGLQLGGVGLQLVQLALQAVALRLQLGVLAAQLLREGQELRLPLPAALHVALQLRDLAVQTAHLLLHGRHLLPVPGRGQHSVHISLCCPTVSQIE